MGLIECPDCKGHVSDIALACPHCGRPMGVEAPDSVPPVLAPAATPVDAHVTLSAWPVAYTELYDGIDPQIGEGENPHFQVWLLGQTPALVPPPAPAPFDTPADPHAADVLTEICERCGTRVEAGVLRKEHIYSDLFPQWASFQRSTVSYDPATPPAPAEIKYQACCPSCCIRNRWLVTANRVFQAEESLKSLGGTLSINTISGFEKAVKDLKTQLRGTDLEALEAVSCEMSKLNSTAAKEYFKATNGFFTRLTDSGTKWLLLWGLPVLIVALLKGFGGTSNTAEGGEELVILILIYAFVFVKTQPWDWAPLGTPRHWRNL